jgi:hypothetical protein
MPSPNLIEATQLALAAAACGDLQALGRALDDRSAAIPYATPAEQERALADGETVGRLLTELKRNLVSEHGRLEQLRSTFAQSRGGTVVNFHA